MSNPVPSASRVLVAGDSLTCGGVLVIFLENAGYDVISVRDGNQALKALRLHPFDLAVLDHDMPDHGALAALAELRGFLPRLPVIVRSGPLSPHESSRYAELGAEILLCKSVDPAALREKINATLGNTLLAPAFPCPLLAGRSLLAARLNTDVARLREFRSVALLEGRHGAGRYELSLEAAAPPTRKFVCHADELDASRLETLLRPALADSRPVLLVILESERVPPEKQTLLEALVRGRLAPFTDLSNRLRLLLCSQKSLCDLHFNEFLLLRAVTATFRIPDFSDRWQDWADISRAILRRTGAGRSLLSPEAIKWIDRHRWTGDYTQLHRTIELARRLAGVTSTISDTHLATAFAQESTCDIPLFHDLLFHVHSGDDT